MNIDLTPLFELLLGLIIPLALLLRYLAWRTEKTLDTESSSGFGRCLFAIGIGLILGGMIPVRMTNFQHTGILVLSLCSMSVGTLILYTSRAVLKEESVDREQKIMRFANSLRLTGSGILIVLVVVFIVPWGLTLILCVPLLIGCAYARRARTWMDQGVILWTLALSMKSGRDLATELELISSTLSRRFRRRVDRLIFQLTHGTPLSSSLSRIPGIVPNAALLAIRAGDTNGYLQQAVVEAATQHGQQHRLRPMSGFSPTMATMYVMCVPLIAAFIVFGLLEFIIPKFKEIFEGFDTELPQQTISLIRCADFLASGPWALLLLLLFIGLNIFAMIVFLKGFREIDYPLVGRFLRRLDVPGILRILSSTADEKRPFAETIHLISFAHRRTAIKNSLENIEQSCQQGTDLWQAMQTNGLITKPESALLKSAQNAGNLPWTLNQLADSLERRFAFRWMAILEFLQPAVVLFLGFLTFFICLAMFMPLIKLLNDLS